MSQVANWFERKFDSMGQTAPEVNRIGLSGARIVRVTHKHIEYIDVAGQEQFVDLEECARNWVRWYDDHSQEFIPVASASRSDIDAENACCVGLRGALDRPPWVEFMNERKTRFEFDTWEALWRELQGPLMQAGWSTFDTN